MTKYGKCLWIIDTLLHAGELSLKELNEKWERSSLRDAEDTTRLHERTFARYKDFIASEYGIDIDYIPSTRKYHIANTDEIKSNALYRYLLAAYRVSDLNSHMIRRRAQMMFEPTPTGVEHLESLLTAIDRGCTIQFDYQSYYQTELISNWEVIPCFLRIFEGRWYLIAELTDRSDTRRLALERMSSLRITEHKIIPSPGITPQEFFDGCYGIIRESHLKPELIYLKADKQQRNYLRAQPLHESQEEIEIKTEHSIFTYFVRPSFDFFQRILWMRDKVEIIAPSHIRSEITQIVKRLAQIYQ